MYKTCTKYVGKFWKIDDALHLSKNEVEEFMKLRDLGSFWLLIFKLYILHT